jgi:hypothetical protein
MAMDTNLLVERTFCEVGLPLWVERVGVLPDFCTAPDFGFACIHKAYSYRSAVWSTLPRLDRKLPSSIAQGWEIMIFDPVGDAKLCWRQLQVGAVEDLREDRWEVWPHRSADQNRAWPRHLARVLDTRNQQIIGWLAELGRD